MVRYILQPLFARFDRIGEYVFLLAIGWCLGVAELFEYAGLSREIGAFIAGISIATSPIAAYIALNLKPLRDFFLILFFFSLGGGFDLSLIPHIAASSTRAWRTDAVPKTTGVSRAVAQAERKPSTGLGYRLSAGTKQRVLTVNCLCRLQQFANWQ